MATSYSNPGGTGNRTASITASATTALFNDNSLIQQFLNGSFANATYVPDGTAFIGKNITFDFGTGKVVDEVRLIVEIANSQATWQPSGSNNGTDFTDIGSPVAFTVANSALLTFTNSTSYRYYRLTGSSGTVSQTWWQEVEFKIDDPPGVVSVDKFCTEQMQMIPDTRVQYFSIS